MSLSVSLYIIALVVGNTLAMWWLIRWTSKPIKSDHSQDNTTGHTWDDDLQEFNNPLPRWWLWMFYFTIAFTGLYLALFPGLGTFNGLLGWSSTGQYDGEMAAADERYQPIFAEYMAKDVIAVAADPKAREMGQRLFVTYCASCHGSDARGALGFPNLADNDWLWGAEPDAIKTSILNGRQGAMPAWGPILGDEKVDQVAQYVLTLAGREADAAKAQAGQAVFTTNCAACHGLEGKGNALMGAPNLTDNVWLYGGSAKSVVQTIATGRMGKMPAHKDFLGEEKVHLLAAYVYSLSHSQ